MNSKNKVLTVYQKQEVRFSPLKRYQNPILLIIQPDRALRYGTHDLPKVIKQLHLSTNIYSIITNCNNLANKIERCATESLLRIPYLI